MTTFNAPHGGWNLFARVLQETLAEHGYGLGHLDDRTDMHPEKVRRLQRSLKVPKSFPILNIYEMEQVTTAFRLNWQEKIRLRAALLATSIEETLMDRIHPDDALRAAEQILPIIEQALRAHTDEMVGIGAVKGLGMLTTPDDSEIDRKLGRALASIDHATLTHRWSALSERGRRRPASSRHYSTWRRPIPPSKRARRGASGTTRRTTGWRLQT